MIKGWEMNPELFVICIQLYLNYHLEKNEFKGGWVGMSREWIVGKFPAIGAEINRNFEITEIQ